MFIAPYIKITRPINAAITACAVLLGMWLTSSAITVNAVLLMMAAAAAAAYGNVVNDLFDIKSDRVSHPDRPLACGAMSIRGAVIFAVILIITSLACAISVSTFHALAALIPIAILTLYSAYFKRTMIVGNLMVASLTAYALLYGSLPDNRINILIAPAILAFLLNFCREIVKDVQDAAGDRAAGWRTTAELPIGIIKAVLIIVSIVYMTIVLLPSLMFGHFGVYYTYICMIAVIPLHIYWGMIVLRADFQNHTKKVGNLLKIEMAVGLFALAFDRGIIYIM